MLPSYPQPKIQAVNQKFQAQTLFVQPVRTVINTVVRNLAE